MDPGLRREGEKGICVYLAWACNTRAEGDGDSKRIYGRGDRKKQDLCGKLNGLQDTTTKGRADEELE